MNPDPLDALLADAVAAEASRARAAERVLRQAAEEGATFIGTLVELAERGSTVTLRTAAGRTHRGGIMGVGRDFVVLRDATLPPVLLRMSAITSVRPTQPAAHDTTGSRSAPIAASFAAVLGTQAGHRPRVHVVVEGDHQPLLGELRAAGQDVVTLRIDGPAMPTVYVPIGAIHEVVLIDIG